MDTNALAPKHKPVSASSHRSLNTGAIPVRTRLVWRRKRLLELGLSALIVVLTIALTFVVASVWLRGVTEQLPPCTDEIALTGGMCSGPIVD